jgi:aryl-alcohol dehydrogenase
VLNVLRPRVGSSIAVYGVGSVGLAAIIAAAKFTPATKIIAIDIQDARLELAKELGATHTINSKSQDVVELVKTLTNGEGTDGALDATGNVEVIESMIAAAANNGTVVTVGGAPKGKMVQIEAATWIGRNVSYVGSCQGSSLPQVVSSDLRTRLSENANLGQFIPTLVALWKQGRFPFDRLITKYPYTEINRAIDDMNRGRCVKAVLLWE